VAGTNKDHRPDIGPGSSVNVDGCRAGDITYWPRGVCRRVLKSRVNREGSSGKAAAANRTREIRLSGMRGGLAETWAMGAGLRSIGKPVDKPPNPKAARAALLPDPDCGTASPNRCG
jgi:hypothetical protein